MVIPRVVVRLSFLAPRGPLSGQAMYIRALVNNVETHEIPIELTCYYLALRTAKAPRKQCLDSGAHQVMGSGLLDCYCCRVRYYFQLSIVESRFLESSVSRTSRYFEPIFFPLDLLHSSSIISSPISRSLEFSKLPVSRINFSSLGAIIHYTVMKEIIPL